jgi:WxL domain surface cell wall-binding
MRDLMHVVQKRLVRVLLAGVLVTGAIAAPTLLAAGTAEAASCGGAVAAGTSCTLVGTVALTGGSLTLTSPSVLNWTGTLNGLDQSLVDTSPGDQQFTVNDATGMGAGWHVTTSATQFTNGTKTFVNTGTFVTNGSATSITSTNGPSATCTNTCTVPTDTTTYPVPITTAAVTPTPVTIYDTATGTGMGQMVIGNTPNPVGWWVNVPASASAGSYTSTITMEIISGP